MKPKDVILIIVVFAVAAAYGFGRTFLKAKLQPPGSEAALREMALELNRSLPKMIDADTQLAFTSGADHEFAFHYKIVSRKAEEVQVGPFEAELRKRLIPASCSDHDLQERFFKNGTTVSHQFQGSDGMPIVTVDVTPQDCATSRAL